MNHFKFRIFNRRHNNEITYRVTKTTQGWHIEHISINGKCDPEGTPLFYDNFSQDDINYPSGFGLFLKHVWLNLDKSELSFSEAQIKLQQLADWVSLCERSQPMWEEWNI